MKKFLTRFITINPFSITLASILLVIALFFTGVPILEFIELKAYDLRFLIPQAAETLLPYRLGGDR